jgi:hypothetical protein
MTQAIGPQVDAKNAYKTQNTSVTLMKHRKHRNTHDINAHKCDQHTLTSQVVHRDGYANNRDQEFAHTHTNRTDKQQAAAAKPLDTPHARQGHEHVYDVCCNRDEERIRDTRIFKEGGTVVENEVDTRELLPSF